MAALVEVLLADMLDQGVPPEALGPTLVQGFARLYRRLPSATPGVEKSQMPMLYAMLGSGTNPLKMAPVDAAYQESPVGGQSCEKCSSSYTNSVSGELVCSQVDGTIKARGWCRLWNTDRF
jgi:hypothetical protein